MPPALDSSCRHSGQPRRRTYLENLTVHRSAAFPVLELNRPKSMANPRVEVFERPWCLSQMKIGLPSRQITPQLFSHLFQASTTRATSDLSDAVSEGFQRLGGHCGLDHLVGPPTKAVAEKFPAKSRTNRGFRFVNLQVKLRIEAFQRFQDSLTCPPTANIDITIVGIPDKYMVRRRSQAPLRRFFLLRKQAIISITQTT